MTYRVVMVLDDGTRITTWAQGRAADVERDMHAKHSGVRLMSLKPINEARGT